MRRTYRPMLVLGLILAAVAPAWGQTAGPILASDADDALRILVSGSAATTIRWVAVVRTAEVAQ